MRHMKTNSATLLPMVFAVAACAADDNQISNSAAPAADPSLAGVSAFEQPSAPADAAGPGRRELGGISGHGPGGGTTDPGQGEDPGPGDGTVSACTYDADCPASNDPCSPAVCSAGVCGTSPVAEGSVLPAQFQVRGDCRSSVCGVAGSALSSLDLDDASDDNECTLDSCSESGASHTFVAPGTSCSKGKCAEDGICHASGDTIWKAQIAMPGKDVAVDCVTLDSEGGIVVSGRIRMMSFPFNRGFIAKVNNHGGQPWHQEFGDRVSNKVYPAIGADNMIVAQFASNFETTNGQASNLVALSSGGASLWQHGTPAGVSVSPAGLAVDADGSIRAAHSFQLESCADFGGGMTCDDGAVSYDQVGNFVGFEAGAAMSMVCDTNAHLATGSMVSAVAMGSMLTVSLSLQ